MSLMAKRYGIRPDDGPDPDGIGPGHVIAVIRAPHLIKVF